jgi:glyoxylase-like metal-dependent hydrolase (beta-lactamase superfamily II)
MACTAGPSVVPLDDIGTVLAPDVTLIAGGFVPGLQPDGNTVIFRGREGLLVFDSGRHAEHSQRILDYAEQSHTAIAAVVNSHWHLDHISGNPRLREAYPQLTVYASSAIEAAMSGFLARSRQQYIERLAEPGDAAQQSEMRLDLATIDLGEALYPDVAITGSGRHSLAGRLLHVGLEADAVTGADVWLYDPATRILASGDLVTLPAPFFDTACPLMWQHVLRRLAALDFDTLVPGHGGPMSQSRFAVYRNAFDNLLACAASSAAGTQCIDGWNRDASVFLTTDADRELASALLDYYIDNKLRSGAPDAVACN